MWFLCMLHSGRRGIWGVDNDADGLGRGVSVAKEGSYISLEIASRLNGTMPHDLKPFIVFLVYTRLPGLFKKTRESLLVHGMIWRL